MNLGGEGPGAPAGDRPDSRTRDHLANERTYLAWLRTAANVMVLGLAVAKFADQGSTGSIVAGALRGPRRDPPLKERARRDSNPQPLDP